MKSWMISLIIWNNYEILWNVKDFYIELMEIILNFLICQRFLRFLEIYIKLKYT